MPKTPTAAQERATARARAEQDARRAARARALERIAEQVRYARDEAAARQSEMLAALDDENLARLTAVYVGRVAFTVELLARAVADLAELER